MPRPGAGSPLRARSGARPPISRPGCARDYLVLRRQVTSWDPDRLRWHPQCPWKGVPGDRTGCMVAPINDHVTGLVTGVWRIRPVLQGEVERRGLAPKRQHASRLFHAPGHELGLAEGVEDALAAHELSGLPVLGGAHGREHGGRRPAGPVHGRSRSSPTPTRSGAGTRMR